MREALFSIWQAQVSGCSFLDLFAGSGAVGVEALSRGAAQVTAIEGSASTARDLETLLRDESTFRVLCARLPDGLATPPARRFDLIFADPPYRFDAHERLLTRIAPWLAEQGELAIEHASDGHGLVGLSDLAPGEPGATEHDLTLIEQRRYGTTQISFFRHAEPAGTDSTR